MVLRVKHTPTRFPNNSLYTSMDNTSLHSISSVRHPCGQSLYQEVYQKVKGSWQAEQVFPTLHSHITRQCGKPFFHSMHFHKMPKHETLTA